MLAAFLSLLTAFRKFHVGGNGVKSELIGITRPSWLPGAPPSGLTVAIYPKGVPLPPALVLAQSGFHF